ncbi:MAG: putative glucanase [Parcubacteria bacterium C7867-003]|nr:MAG: putative glucanase [Parcubacteria bacterium C7867-003]
MKSKVFLFCFVFLTLLFLKPTSLSAAVEVYPGPGGNAFKSDLYNVEVWDGSAWVPAYVYKRAKVSTMHWHIGTVTSVNFLTFGTTGQVNVRISKLSGSITSISVSPKSKNIPNSITNGQATLTLNINDKTWITINGDDANPLFIFADNLKPAVPAPGPGLKYFGPGVHDISPGTGNHYYPSDNETIYLDGGAWVKGNIISTGKTNVQIMGPGILSGDLWDAQTVQNLGWTGMQDYFMIYAASYGVVGDTTVSGITIVDSPTFNVYNVKSAYSAKVLSPWHAQTDGFNGVDIDQVFAFNGDTTFNAYMGYWSPITNSYSINTRLTNSFGGTTNNAVFLGGFYGNPGNTNFTSTVDNLDIKTYNDNSFVPYGAPHEPSVFQVWVGTNDSTYGYRNQIYQNIRIEGNVNAPLLQLMNRVYPVSWGGPMYDPPLGNSYDLTFKNISLEGSQNDLMGKKSEIKGWDANNGFHNILLENVSIGGTVINQSNISNYIDVNSYVWGLSFGPPPVVSFSANPTTITLGGSSTLTWSATNATSCTASGDWSGSKATSGSQSVSPTINSTYTITCTNSGGGVATKSVNIKVAQLNPIAFWTLDQTSGTNALDTSGNSYNGTLFNYTGSSWTTGKVSNALNFDGIDDQVKISNATALTSLTGLTVSAWVNPRGSGGNGSGAGTIVSKRGVVGSSARFRLMMGSDGTSLQFNSAYSTVGGSWKTPTGSLPLNSWHHVVLTYTHEDVNSIPKIYINGVLQTLTTLTTPSGTAISDDDIIYIGSRGINATSGVFDGTIDQVRIYEREISSGEVTNLYNSENSTGVIDFSLSSSGTAKVMQAKSVTSTITATLAGGISGAVTFSASGLPTGATASFSPTSCSPTCTTTLTLSSLSTTPVGNSTITVTGTAGTVSRTTTFTLDINYRGDINNDGIVNSLDWSLMNAKWFTNDSGTDLNADGVVNAIDFSLLNANWFRSG